jgi:tetratricopeptide (TPR) repeat protein
MSDAPLLSCPYCGGTVPPSTTLCPTCNEDLAALARLEYGHLVLYNEALALAREGQIEAAQAKLHAVLAAREDFVPAHLLLAKVHAQLGRWAAAAESAARALALAPSDERAQALAQAIETAAQESRATRLAEERQTAQTRRRSAEGYLAAYQRDTAAAFGLGALLAGVVVMLLTWLGGRNRS